MTKKKFEIVQDLRTRWTPEKKRVFLEMLEKHCDVKRAAAACGMSRARIYALRDKYSGFREQWNEAVKIAIDAMEAECYRRAFEGVDHPVIHLGEITDTYKDYSDVLLMFYLKAHRPQYRDKVSHLHGGSIEHRHLTAVEVASRITSILDAAEIERAKQLGVDGSAPVDADTGAPDESSRITHKKTSS